MKEADAGLPGRRWNGEQQKRVSLRFVVQRLEYSNMRKRRREVGEQDPGKICSEN